MGIYESTYTLVNDMLKTYGQVMYISHEVDKYTDDFGEKHSSIIKSKVYGIETSYNTILTSLITTTGLKKGDKNVLITANAGKPNIGDTLVSNNILHKVISVKPHAPAGIDLMYELHCRTYAVVEETDTLVALLGNLTTGAIIADTSRDNLQTWRLVAHNHFLPGYSTLILDSLFSLEQQAFNGTGGYPSSPWTSTWMRKYLLSTFKNTLSPSLISIIKDVNVTTNKTISNETIYLLTKTELGGGVDLGTEYTTGVSNYGTKIPYFDIDSKRIASYDGTNTTYWTRDFQGVGSDGKFKTLNPNYAYGIRPVINIRSTVECALNLGGEYEIQFP